MSAGESTHDLAIALEPTLRAVCQDRLSPIEWFMTAQQRGGAATGAATWRDDNGQTESVIVKLPVGPAEFNWNVHLGSDRAAGERPVVPRLVAGDRVLGGYDLAWVVVERLGPPLDPGGLSKDIAVRALTTVARFQHEAGDARPVAGKPRDYPWEQLIERSREVARDHLVNMPDLHRWNEALKRVAKASGALIPRWRARPIDAWCHGDVHAANIMHCGDHDDTLALIDLGLVHPGSWIEDAMYLERQYWAHPEALHGVKPLQTLARARRGLALDNGEDYAEIAQIQRLLLAACVPARYVDEGTPAYAAAALDHAERLVKHLV